MTQKLFFVGLLLATAAAIVSLVALNMNAGGVPDDVHPVGALALGVSAIAFLYASHVAPS